jgi:hypothetical protein
MHNVTSNTMALATPKSKTKAILLHTIQHWLTQPGSIHPAGYSSQENYEPRESSLELLALSLFRFMG